MPYKPNPLDTSKVLIPGNLNELIEQMAENTHEVWASERMAQGWTYGPQRDDAKKHHPDLIPYDELNDDEKEFDRKTAMETLNAILALGYSVCKL